MKVFKKFSLIMLSTLLFACSAFVLTGCGKDNDICKLYVFASVGGYVQVDDHEEVVEFGDEGSRIFTYKEDNSVSLKAIANDGYRFVKWQFTDDLADEYADNAHQSEIKIRLDDEEVVVKAIFELDGSISYNVTYPTNTTGYTISLETGYSNIVVLGGDFKFKVTLWEDYSNSSMVVKVNNVVCTPNNGVYTVSNINNNISITVEGVTLNEDEIIHTPTIYGVFTQDNRFTIVPVGQNNCEVAEGNSFTFTISPAEGYKLGDNVVVKAAGNVLAENNGLYTINSVTQNINIVVEGIEETTYTIFTQATSYNITPVSQATCVVKEGSSFTFTITLVNGYKFGDNVIVKADGLILIANNEQYTITSVTKDIEITVEGIEELGEYSIYTNDNTFAIVPVGQNTCKVEEGSSFTFTIELKAGYKFGSNVVVKADGIDLTENNGQYTIYSVITDMEITIEGIEEEDVVTYTISTKDTTYTITPVGQINCEVQEGASFTFTITLSSGYKFSDNVVVKANNQTLTVNSNQYTITNINSNIEITVTGIEQEVSAIYTISTKDTTYSITPVGQINCEVQEGASFAFTIEPANGYKLSNTIVVKANGMTLTASNSKYTINSVTTDIEITVEGVEEIVTYTFALSFEESINEFNPDLALVIPESVSFNIIESEKKLSYTTSQFIVIDDQEQETSIKDLVNIINEEYAISNVKQLTINNEAFITINGDNMIINWSLLQNVSSNYNLIIKFN